MSDLGVLISEAPVKRFPPLCEGAFGTLNVLPSHQVQFVTVQYLFVYVEMIYLPCTKETLRELGGRRLGVYIDYSTVSITRTQVNYIQPHVMYPLTLCLHMQKICLERVPGVGYLIPNGTGSILHEAKSKLCFGDNIFRGVASFGGLPYQETKN